MLRRHPMMDEFDKQWKRSRRPDYLRNLRIFEALYQEARTLGVLPPRDPLRGIEHDIELARVLNVRRTAGDDRPTA
jgi:hypothetical protein